MCYSKDLIKKAPSFIDQARQLRFVIGLSIQYWQHRKNETGEVARVFRAIGPYKVDPRALKAYILDHPDACLNEIAALLVRDIAST